MNWDRRRLAVSMIAEVDPNSTHISRIGLKLQLNRPPNRFGGKIFLTFLNIYLTYTFECCLEPSVGREMMALWL